MGVAGRAVGVGPLRYDCEHSSVAPRVDSESAQHTARRQLKRTGPDRSPYKCRGACASVKEDNEMPVLSNYWFDDTDFRGNTEFLSQPHCSTCWAWINWSNIG